MSLFFENIPEATATILKTLAKEKFIKDFTLVGGTSLALQLGHRQSEDLDFIYDGEKIPSLNIKRNISTIFKNYKIIREETGFQIDFLIQGVKLKFFSTGAVIIPFKVMDFSFNYDFLRVATVDIIAVLKMSTIAQRCTIRDYYDLYYLAKNVLGLKEIFKSCKQLLPNLSAITYTETIVYVKDISENSLEEHLNPKEIASKQQIADYFYQQLKIIYKKVD